jgi:hypothetical protein
VWEKKFSLIATSNVSKIEFIIDWLLPKICIFLHFNHYDCSAAEREKERKTECYSRVCKKRYDLDTIDNISWLFVTFTYFTSCNTSSSASSRFSRILLRRSFYHLSLSSCFLLRWHWKKYIKKYLKKWHNTAISWW